MAEGNPAPVVSLFPPPPPWFRMYLNKEEGMPPPPPITDEPFHVLDYIHDPRLESLYKPLSEDGVVQVYKERTKEELVKLNRSLIFQYLALLRSLSGKADTADPSGISSSPGTDYKKAIEDIQITLINSMHLINSFRPSEAMIAIMGAMEDRSKRRRQLSEELRNSRKRLEIIAEQCAAHVSQTAKSADLYPSLSDNDSLAKHDIGDSDVEQRPLMEVDHAKASEKCFPEVEQLFDQMLDEIV